MTCCTNNCNQGRACPESTMATRRALGLIDTRLNDAKVKDEAARYYRMKAFTDSMESEPEPPRLVKQEGAANYTFWALACFVVTVAVVCLFIFGRDVGAAISRHFF